VGGESWVSEEFGVLVGAAEILWCIGMRAVKVCAEHIIMLFELPFPHVLHPRVHNAGLSGNRQLASRIGSVGSLVCIVAAFPPPHPCWRLPALQPLVAHSTSSTSQHHTMANSEVKIATAALAIAIAALLIALGQLVSQLFGTADGYRNVRIRSSGAGQS
jgi:hypothetical protein